MSQPLLAHILLHPHLTQSLKVLATTVGRDKVYRLVQYLARLISWSVLKAGGEKEIAMRWDGLKGGLANGRKMMRIVKPVEHLQSALGASASAVSSPLAPLASNLATVAQIARQLFYAGYLTTDMIVWLQGVKFLRLQADKHSQISRLSQRFWFLGILSSLVSSLSSLFRLRAEGRRLALNRSAAGGLSGKAGSGEGEKAGPEGEGGENERREVGRRLLKERSTLISQIVQDSMDVWIPANNLGYSHLNDGVIGALGAATSYMALQQQWIKVNGAGAGGKSK